MNELGKSTTHSFVRIQNYLEKRIDKNKIITSVQKISHNDDEILGINFMHPSTRMMGNQEVDEALIA